MISNPDSNVHDEQLWRIVEFFPERIGSNVENLERRAVFEMDEFVAVRNAVVGQVQFLQPLQFDIRADLGNTVAREIETGEVDEPLVQRQLGNVVLREVEKGERGKRIDHRSHTHEFVVRRAQFDQLCAAFERRQVGNVVALERNVTQRGEELELFDRTQSHVVQTDRRDLQHVVYSS